jgi:hypothetical protein
MNRLLQTTIMLMAAGVISLLAGCVSPPETSVMLDRVGPGPEAASCAPPQGGLEVFSRLARRTDDQNQDSTYPVWYQHSDYYICDLQGKILRRVHNVVGHFEETPKLVNLPAGEYLVLAQAKGYYWVKAPVEIKRGQTTTVHLDGGWIAPSYAGSSLVKLPNGQAVGWGM